MHLFQPSVSSHDPTPEWITESRKPVTYHTVCITPTIPTPVTHHQLRFNDSTPVLPCSCLADEWRLKGCFGLMVKGRRLQHGLVEKRWAERYDSRQNEGLWSEQSTNSVSTTRFQRVTKTQFQELLQPAIPTRPKVWFDTIDSTHSFVSHWCTLDGMHPTSGKGLRWSKTTDSGNFVRMSDDSSNSSAPLPNFSSLILNFQDRFVKFKGAMSAMCAQPLTFKHVPPGGPRLGSNFVKNSSGFAQPAHHFHSLDTCQCRQSSSPIVLPW